MQCVYDNSICLFDLCTRNADRVLYRPFVVRHAHAHAHTHVHKSHARTHNNNNNVYTIFFFFRTHDIGAESAMSNVCGAWAAWEFISLRHSLSLPLPLSLSLSLYAVFNSRIIPLPPSPSRWALPPSSTRPSHHRYTSTTRAPATLTA